MFTRKLITLSVLLGLTGCNLNINGTENSYVPSVPLPATPLVIDNLERLQNAPLIYRFGEGYIFDHENSGITLPAGTIATLCHNSDSKCSSGIEVYPKQNPIRESAFEISNVEYKIVYSNPANTNSVTSEPFSFSVDEANSSISELTASNAELGDFFGWSTAISGDGKTIVVGAKMEDSASNNINDLEHDNSSSNSGALYVFELIEGRWEQTHYLKKWFSGKSDELGFSVAINFDGTIIVSGAPWDDSSATGINTNTNDDSMTQSGALYIFEKEANEWKESAYVKSSMTVGGQMLGFDVDISNDDVIVAGVKGDSSGRGAAIVLSKASGNWTEEAILRASNGDINDAFGDKVAISGDGQTILVGAPKESSATSNESDGDNSATDSGAAYVFKKSSSWAQSDYIKAEFINAGDRFGYNVCINADGSRYAITSRDHSSGSGFNADGSTEGLTDSGSVSIYENGTLLHLLKSPSPEENTRFGLNCSLDGLGHVIAVSERSNFTGNGYEVDYSSILSLTGSVSLFNLENMTINTIMSPNMQETTAGFFRDVAISDDGSTVVTGEYEEFDESGRAYVYGIK